MEVTAQGYTDLQERALSTICAIFICVDSLQDPQTVQSIWLGRTSRTGLGTKIHTGDRSLL